MFSWQNQAKPIVALAPMADMTDSAFCQTVKEVTGASTYPVMFREMVSAEAVVRGNEKTLDMTDIHPAERPLVQQIFGSDPETMARAAAKIYEEHQPEAFDVNMGCPVYKIVHNFNGCALMNEPERAAAIIKAMKAAVPVPVSAKFRLGWADPTMCLTFIKVLEQAGVDLVTIHGRTKAQGYSGVADWDMVGRARQQAPQLTVLVNGDIHRPEQLPQALQTSGCDGALIARGALGNPWFFAHAQQIIRGETPTPVTLEERIRVVERHLHHHLTQYGTGAVSTFRKHLSWYFKGIPHMKPFKERLMTTTNPEELRATLLAMLDQPPEHP
jgi:tRNA-dihydrouridine synthase B